MNGAWSGIKRDVKIVNNRLATQNNRSVASIGNRTDIDLGLEENIKDDGLAVEDDRLAVEDDGLVVEDDRLAAKIDKKTDVDDQLDVWVGNQEDAGPGIGENVRANSLDFSTNNRLNVDLIMDNVVQ